MELLHYFEPVSTEVLKDCDVFNKYPLSGALQINSFSKPLKSLEGIEIAILGVPEERHSLNKGCGFAPDIIRKYLYQLSAFEKNTIADLGNLKSGNTVQDTYIAVRDVIIELVSSEIVPITIGGSQDLTFAVFQSFEKLEQTVNLVTVDARFDLGDVNDPMNANNYLSKIITQKSNCLFNVTNLGYQAYYVSQEEIDLMKNILFDYNRLGYIQADIREAEPFFRDANMVSIDISAVRQSDAPGHFFPSPNGFYGEELCQLCRYAGLSDKVSWFGLFEVNPEQDINNQTSHLAAQAIWHFIEGFYLRKKEYPFTSLQEYRKIVVKVEEPDYEIIFYNNPATQRWWMEIPYQKAEYQKSMIIACSSKDYDNACKQEIPDRWWKTFQKIC